MNNFTADQIAEMLAEDSDHGKDYYLATLHKKPEILELLQLYLSLSRESRREFWLELWGMIERGEIFNHEKG